MIGFARRLSAASVALAFALGMPASGWAQSALAQKLTPLYEAAAKEGEVVLYTGTSDAATSKLSDYWKANFPKVRLSILHKQSPDIAADIEAQKAAGRLRVDVVTIALPYVAALWKEKGYFQSYKTMAFDALAPEDKDPDGAFVSTGFFALTAAYNTEAIRDKGQLPQRLHDFLDPKWKDKLVIAHPRTAGQARTFFMAMLQRGAIDWAFMEQLAKQNVMIVRTNPDAARMLAAGERIASPMISSQNILIAKTRGQSVDLYVLREGAVVSGDVGGILAAAPHPEAAKLLFEVLTSTEGQEVVAGGENQWPSHPQAKVAPHLPQFADSAKLRVDLKTLLNPQTSEEFLRRFDEVFQRN